MAVLNSLLDELQKIAEVAQVEEARKTPVSKVDELKRRLRVGDILFSAPDRERQPLKWKVFKTVSELLQGTDYGHNALYVGDGKIIENRIGETVSVKPLEAMTRRNNVLVMRPDVSAAERKEAVEYAHTQLGKPYDVQALAKAVLPLPSSGTGKTREELEALICSALVANAYNRRKFSDKARAVTLPADMLKARVLKTVTILERFNLPQDR